MSLGSYQRKRSFDTTPEPKGDARRKYAKKLAFVVQKHQASHLHYDFRLELDGVLKSWAVPKGPSLDPHDRHLAVMVEDHPYEYRKFEGIIPEGNYGAGEVVIWDEGMYEPREPGSDPQAILRQELKAGHLTFILYGKKLKGEFALIKMHHAEENAWLLVKKDDTHASKKEITADDGSVKSGKTTGRVPELARYPKKAAPWHVKPMLCTLVDEPFDRDGWLFEIKWDGYRAIGSKHKDAIELYSRNGLNFIDKYPPIAEALRLCKHDVVLDGEIVVVDADGRPRFEWLQNWPDSVGRHDELSGFTPERSALARTKGGGALAYYVFDILWCDGHDVRTMPLIERKQLLRMVLPKRTALHFSDHVEKSGIALFRQMQRRGLEGIIAKNGQSEYVERSRGTAWLKIKAHLQQEVVIGGFTEPRGGRKYLGSLLVGVYDKGNLVYVGHSGGGIADEERKRLRQVLERHERRTSPFVVQPKPNAPVHWVRPELVCEMGLSEWTNEGVMRQPRYMGLREDKAPEEVRREIPQHEPSRPADKKPGASSPLQLTHPDKLFFPKHGYTKGDIVAYYRSVADYILPYLKDRPHSLLRQPNGIKGESFFQKNNEHLPDWVPSADIYSDSNGKNLHWIVGGSLTTLLYMVQLGCVEINPWSSRVGHLNNPDWLVIDLDPEGIGFKHVVEVALTVKAVCNGWAIDCYAKTSGKTGIHIYVPLGAKYDYGQAKNLAHLIAIEVNNRQPQITSLERLPEKRQGKIYLDFLQNREGQTLAAPYSLRPTPDATVSTPLHWDEVTSALDPRGFTIKNILHRLKREGDLWAPVMKKGVALAKLLWTIEETRPPHKQ